MIHAIGNLGTSACGYAVSVTSYAAKTARKAVSNVTIDKVSSIALPLITTVVLSNLQRVAADPFTDCIDSCSRWESEAQILCYAICWLGSIFTK